MPKKPPLRSPSDAYRRQAIAERRIGTGQCSCGETRPQALIAGSRPLVCAACQRAENGQSTEDDHHIAGAANDETTICVPVNDHRADLTIAQSDWPKATLQNSEGRGPLRASAWCKRKAAQTSGGMPLAGVACCLLFSIPIHRWQAMVLLITADLLRGD